MEPRYTEPAVISILPAMVSLLLEFTTAMPMATPTPLSLLVALASAVRLTSFSVAVITFSAPPMATPLFRVASVLPLPTIRPMAAPMLTWPSLVSAF